MKRTTMVLVAGALVASGCSGGTSATTRPDTTGSPINTTDSEVATPTTVSPEGTNSSPMRAPCSYVTDTEMSSFIGKEVTGAPASDLLCVYTPADAGTGGIEVLIQDVADVGCDLIFSVGGFDDEEQVSEVGTSARYKAGGVSQIAVCYDDRVALTATMYAEPPDPKAVLINVATAVEAGVP